MASPRDEVRWQSSKGERESAAPSSTKEPVPPPCCCLAAAAVVVVVIRSGSAPRCRCRRSIELSVAAGDTSARGGCPGSSVVELAGDISSDEYGLSGPEGRYRRTGGRATVGDCCCWCCNRVLCSSSCAAAAAAMEAPVLTTDETPPPPPCLAAVGDCDSPLL